MSDERLPVLCEDARSSAAADDLLSDALVVSLRPRTATMHKGMTTTITVVDDHAVGMLGWTPDQMVGLRSSCGGPVLARAS